MINPNEPAFPMPHVFNSDDQGIAYGITVRAYLAAMAMQGVLAGRVLELNRRLDRHESTMLSAEMSQWAVVCADALIAELNKETK